MRCLLLQPCHVVYTEYRPTPLQHYIFPAGGDGIHLVVDENVSLSLIAFAPRVPLALQLDVGLLVVMI